MNASQYCKCTVGVHAVKNLFTLRWQPKQVEWPNLLNCTAYIILDV